MVFGQNSSDTTLDDKNLNNAVGDVLFRELGIDNWPIVVPRESDNFR